MVSQARPQSVALRTASRREDSPPPRPAFFALWRSPMPPGRLACAARAARAALAAAAGATTSGATSCVLEYEAHFEAFRWASGHATRSDDWEALGRLEEQQRRCRSLQGRLWELHLEEVQLQLPSGLPLRLRPLGVCAPERCGAQDVAAETTPRLLAHRMQVNQSELRFLSEFVTVKELGSWEDIRFDFAIIGIDRCGTTSLHFNLDQHPEIRFVQHEGIYSFLQQSPTLLPWQEHVLAVQRFAEEQGKGFILGYRHSVLYAYSHLLHGLSRMPSLRSILIVCEPLGRLERWFLSESGASERWRSLTEAVEETKTVALAEHQLLGAKFRFGPQLLLAQRLLKDRLLLFHQHSLRSQPVATYERLRLFLGARKPFPAETRFARRNVMSGHRTELCRNASLEERLGQLLAPEFQAIEEALLGAQEPLPEELLRRWTRCHRLREEDAKDIAGDPRPKRRFTK
ncbi:unnamed protein product [Durusdinium trenchii]|uniref:Sulfotransferase n=1 Tax=Durusdinium trenchii TaxID=1381693 RepID=A0ABP0K5W6_9DINO